MRLRRGVALVAAVAAWWSAGITGALPTLPRAQGAGPATYLVGAASRSINPTPAMIGGGRFHLGGYGFGSGRIGNEVPVPGLDGRTAQGIMGEGISSRAIAVSDGRRAIVLAQIETQGYFLAYQQGPYGLEDIRKDAAALLRRRHGGRPRITAGSILVDSNHTHGGPDTVGAWGGVPDEYLKLVHDRTVEAIVAAYDAMVPATLTYGVADGSALLANQFRGDPNNASLDTEVRVLQARDTAGKVIVTYVNFSAHPTVLGGDNRLVTADYVGALQEILAAQYGGLGFQQVATLGRTQPSDRGCQAPRAGETGDECKLREYAERVFAKVKDAVSSAVPVRGPVEVELHSYYLQDPATNGALLALTTPAGGVIGAPIARSTAPPWATGNVLGTVSFSGRIGDLVLSGGPGEMYPQVVDEVRRVVAGHQGYLNIGTAGDFLGYIIAPLEAYPEPIRRTLLDNRGGCGPAGCPSPVDNDNYFFNVSHTLGERLTCSFLRGAGDVFARDPRAYWSRDARCPAFANDLAFGPDADTRLPDAARAVQRVAPAGTAPARFEVGTAVVDITPSTPQYLGGFGRGAPTSTAHDPLQVRAFYIGNGEESVAFAVVDSQGWFAGYQEGPYGVTDARRDAAARLADIGVPGADPSHLIISSTHSHAAPTIMGIWGPTDPAYLKLVHDRTVEAIVAAAEAAEPAELWTGSGDTGAVLGQNVSETDVYDGWAVDPSTPVLWARRPGTGQTIGVYANVPIHADVVNGARLGVMSADHIGIERSALEAELGGTAVVAMGTLGRQESIVQTDGFGAAQDVADFVTARMLEALRSARPVTSDALAAAEQYVVVPATNPALAGLNEANAVAPSCVDAADTCTIDRSVLPPYAAGPAIGTWVTAFRIGDLAYVSEPGEAFPEVSASIRRSITGAAAVHVVGMAQDQLGYYWGPEVAPFTVLNPSDHLIYNVSPLLADETVAAAAADARRIGFGGAPFHSPPLITDPGAYTKPGVQFFAVASRSAPRTVLLDAATTTSTASRQSPAGVLGGHPGDIQWDFGDGTRGTSAGSLQHTFPAPGRYRVTATVQDEGGQLRSWSQWVVV